ncbi:MAG TPA: glutaredoxin family protein [Casimicrobiaceae bacterium]
MKVRSSMVALSIAAALVGAAHAQALYRYVDANGRVVYSDQPPPASARDVQPKQMPENVIETDPVPFAARQAADRFPVTLYTWDCDVCREAQALLAKRGVPFETVIVTEEKGAARVKALTGKQSGPVLQVGEKQVLVGYNEERWQALLDDAGYPRTAPAARPQATRAAASPPGAGAATPEAASDTAAPSPAAGHDYPQ